MLLPHPPYSITAAVVLDRLSIVLAFGLFIVYSEMSHPLFCIGGTAHKKVLLLVDILAGEVVW